MLLVQSLNARTLMARAMTAVLGVDARLQQLEAEVLQWRTTARVVQDADAMSGAMSQAEVDLQEKFGLACEDVQGVTMTAQHACDWMGSALKLVYKQQDELGDLTRSHIALNKAVHKLLDDVSAGCAGSGAQAGAIPASWVQELKDVLAPSVKAMKELKEMVESGLNGASQQLADQDLTPFNNAQGLLYPF